MINNVFLKFNSGIVKLFPRITTIGRDLCDLVVKDSTVDPQHAVIEYIENKNFYILKDLNSTYGTYVDEIRIQNESVKLFNGVIIKFGLCKDKYEFLVDDSYDVTSTSPQATITSTKSYTPTTYQQQQPTLTSSINFPVIEHSPPMQQKHAVAVVGTSIQLPRTPSANNRLGRNMYDENSNKLQTIPTKRNSISLPIKQSLPKNKSQKVEAATITELQNEIERFKSIESKYQEQTIRINNLEHENNDLIKARKKSMSEQNDGQNKPLTKKTNKQIIDTDETTVNNVSNGTRHPTIHVTKGESNASSQRHELDKMRIALQTSNSLVTILQRDLSNRDSTIKKMSGEIEHYKEQMSEKDSSISSLMYKLNQFQDVQKQMQDDSNMQEREQEIITLNQKLQAAKTNMQTKNEEIEHLKKLVDNLNQLDKTNSEMIRSLGLQLAESKVLIGDLQRTEGDLGVESQGFENKYHRIRTQLVQMIKTILGTDIKTSSCDDDEIIGIVNNCLKDKHEDLAQISENQKQCEMEILKQRGIIKNIDMLINEFKGSSTNLFAGDRTSVAVCNFLKSLQSMTFEESLRSLKEALICYINCDYEFLSGLELCVAKAGPSFADLGLQQSLGSIIEQYIKVMEKNSIIEKQLAQLNDDHNAEIKLLKDQYKTELDKKVGQSIKTECSKDYSQLQILKSERDQLELSCKEYEQNIVLLNETVLEKDLQYHDIVKTLSNKCNELDHLDRQWKSVLESKSSSEQINSVNKQLEIQIDKYNEEIAQLNVNINVLNDHVTKLTKENKDLNDKKTKIRSERKKRDANSGSKGSKPGKIIGSDNNKVMTANLERELLLLRNENASLKIINFGNESRLKSISDKEINGSNSTNKVIDRVLLEKEALEKETVELRTQLSSLSGDYENMVKSINDKDTEIQSLESRSSINHDSNGNEIDPTIFAEIFSIGSQCRGDRHVQIIEAQRIALADLRQKMKAIDMTRFQDSNAQAFSLQISLLQKEIAELRASESLREHVTLGTSIDGVLRSKSNKRQSVLALSESEKALESERQEALDIESTRKYKQMQFDLDLMKEALSDQQNSFRMSESCYFELLRQVSKVLDLDVKAAFESLDNLSSDGKKLLKSERSKVCAMLIQRIIIIQESIARKDEVLQSYEIDLCKLKQAEDVTVITAHQMEQLMQQTRNKTDEIDFLRETLSKTKDILNAERRNNRAIKQNNFYDQENNLNQERQQSVSVTLQSNSIPDDDLRQKKEKGKSANRKRKEYDLLSLKSGSQDQERPLSQFVGNNDDYRN